MPAGDGDGRRERSRPGAPQDRDRSGPELRHRDVRQEIAVVVGGEERRRGAPDGDDRARRESAGAVAQKNGDGPGGVVREREIRRRVRVEVRRDDPERPGARVHRPGHVERSGGPARVEEDRDGTADQVRDREVGESVGVEQPGRDRHGPVSGGGVDRAPKVPLKLFGTIETMPATSLVTARSRSESWSRSTAAAHTGPPGIGMRRGDP